MLLLGKYESLGVLGRGSMGTVHAASPADSPGATVVVKVLRAGLADTARLRQSFDREVQYTARLRHPYIVRVLDAGFDRAAGPCIVMEFIRGVTWRPCSRRTAGSPRPASAGWSADCARSCRPPTTRGSSTGT